MRGTLVYDNPSLHVKDLTITKLGAFVATKQVIEATLMNMLHQFYATLHSAFVVPYHCFFFH